MKIINEYIRVFLGDNRKWKVKHWLVYSTITLILAFSHGFTWGIIKHLFI